eukprot:jgi/Bigna1/82342/fgenesh1_pg.91_\
MLRPSSFTPLGHYLNTSAFVSALIFLLQAHQTHTIAVCSSECIPSQVHLSQGPTFESSVVSYTTKCCEEDGESVYEPAIYLGTSKDKIDQQFLGNTHTYTAGGWQGSLHRVKISGLESSTGPAVGDYPVRFVAIADMGAFSDNAGASNSTISALMGEVHMRTIDRSKDGFPLLIHAGDIAYTSGNQEVWDSYFEEMEVVASSGYYQVCVGNHEHYYNFSGYLNRFAMPGETGNYSVDNLWGSYDYGGVHFTHFSTEHSLKPDSDQIAFLEKDLAKAAENRASVPWIVVYGHKPLYCSTNDYYDCKIGGPLHIAPAVEHLFQKYEVDLFLAGHLHNYERSFPVYNGTVMSRSYAPALDTVHMVIGMAGDDEGLTDSWESPQPSWSAIRHAALGYGLVEVHNASHLHFEYVLSGSGKVFDAFDLVRERSS